MYVVQSPVISEDLAARALAACRGRRQSEWTWHMLGPGLDAAFQGRWASSTHDAFQSYRRRLAQLGIRTQELPLGFDEGPLYFITGVLDPAETILWGCSWLNAYERDHCISALKAAGLMDLNWVGRAILLIGRGVAWHSVVEVLRQDDGPLDEDVADLTVELMRTRLTLPQALGAARMATML